MGFASGVEGGLFVDSKFGMPRPLGNPLFFPSLAGRTEPRTEKPCVPLADAKILGYCLIFPMGLLPDRVNAHECSGREHPSPPWSHSHGRAGASAAVGCGTHLSGHQDQELSEGHPFGNREGALIVIHSFNHSFIHGTYVLSLHKVPGPGRASGGDADSSCPRQRKGCDGAGGTFPLTLVPTPLPPPSPVPEKAGNCPDFPLMSCLHQVRTGDINTSWSHCSLFFNLQGQSDSSFHF